MVDRYLGDVTPAVAIGNVEDADAGPEGPPQHVGPGVTA